MYVVQPRDLSTPAAYAQAYAALGWCVLPIEPGSKAPLGRLVPRGMLDASSDKDVIARWWRLVPNAGIGIALAMSGLVAIDIDPRNGGVETFDDLQSAHGSLRSEVMAFTGGGGEHHVFVLPPGMQVSLPGTLGPGVDLKCNGYIVVEPTVHPSGKRYEWEASSNPLDGVAPSPLPDWLRSLRVELQSPAGDVETTPVDPAQARDGREALYMLDADDYDQWIRAGMALHATGWGPPAYAMWSAWSQQSTKFNAVDQRKRWTGFHADRSGGVTLAWLFAEAQKRGWVNPQARLRDTAEVPPYVDHEQAVGALPLLYAEDIQAADGVVQQVVEDVLTAGGLSIFYGTPNCGKSFLGCDLGCCVGAGVEWLGKRTVRGSVLYVAGEGASSIKLRIVAWRQHHALEPWMGVVPRAVNLRLGGDELTRLIAACEQLAKHYGVPVSVIIIDTLARAFGGGNENASEDMGALIRNADVLRERTGAHVALIHHCGKDETKGSRGHSSLHGATDTEIEVTSDEATGARSAEIVKQRDLGSRGMRIGAKFTVVEMGRGQWDKPITTCVVEPVDAPPRVANKSKAAQLVSAVVAALAKASAQTMRKADLVGILKEQGYGSSAIYRCLEQLTQQNVVVEGAGRVHLVGRGEMGTG